MSGLKRCPFCGGKARLWPRGARGRVWAMVCDACGASTYDEESPTQAYAAWNRRADGWISVNERLPDHDDYVLLLEDDGESVHVGYWRDDINAWDNCDNGWVRTDITHWMPLPEPPKEDAK